MTINKKFFISYLLIITSLACHGIDLPERLTKPEILSKPIEKFDLTNGVTAFRTEYNKLITEEIGKFKLSFLIIDWNKNTNIGLSLYMDTTLNRHKPSEALNNNPNAIACINGFYHATVDPSIPYFPTKINGKNWESKQSYIDGVIAFNSFEPPIIGNSKCGYTNYLNYAGADGNPKGNLDVVPEPDYSDKAKLQKRLTSWTARTFVGHNPNKNITVMCVADGYTKDSIGMTFEEGAWIMSLFNIQGKNVTFLDGGGSSVMAIKKIGKVQIINRPSSDHINNIERNVLTSLQIITK